MNLYFECNILRTVERILDIRIKTCIRLIKAYFNKIKPKKYKNKVFKSSKCMNYIHLYLKKMSFLIVLLNIYNKKRKFLYICVFPIFIFLNFKQNRKNLDIM